jgi:hypothetical protein
MKRVRIYLLVVFLGILHALPPLYAGWTDGNKLMEALEGQEKNDTSYRSGYFDGYVQGVADASVGMLWCSPPNVKAGQLSKIVAKYLRAHPELLHNGAEKLVINALQEAFPCNK